MCVFCITWHISCMKYVWTCNYEGRTCTGHNCVMCDSATSVHRACSDQVPVSNSEIRCTVKIDVCSLLLVTLLRNFVYEQLVKTWLLVYTKLLPLPKLLNIHIPFYISIQYGLEQQGRASKIQFLKRDTNLLSLIQTVHLLCNYCMLLRITTANVGCNENLVCLYDSLYGYVTLDTKKQIWNPNSPLSRLISWICSCSNIHHLVDYLQMLQSHVQQLHMDQIQ